MDGVAAILETNLFLFLFNFKNNQDGTPSWWNMALTLIPPLYLYTIQMRMMTAHKAKFNCGQIGPTESETLIGLIILLPAVFGSNFYEGNLPISGMADFQYKHLFAALYIVE